MSKLIEHFPAFEFLEQCGMSVHSFRTDGDGFPGERLELKGAHLWIVLTNDRGDFMVDIGSSPRDLGKIENALELITGRKMVEPVEINELAKEVRENWYSLCEKYSQPAWISELRAYAEKKAMLRFRGRIFPPSSES